MLTIMLLVSTSITILLASLRCSSPWAAASLTFVLNFSFWSINYIAGELEQPFGDDPNDLPMAELQSNFNSSLCVLFDEQAVQPPAFEFENSMLGRSKQRLSQALLEGGSPNEKLKMRCTLAQAKAEHHVAISPVPSPLASPLASPRASPRGSPRGGMSIDPVMSFFDHPTQPHHNRLEIPGGTPFGHGSASPRNKASPRVLPSWQEEEVEDQDKSPMTHLPNEASPTMNTLQASPKPNALLGSGGGIGSQSALYQTAPAMFNRIGGPLGQDFPPQQPAMNTTQTTMNTTQTSGLHTHQPPNRSKKMPLFVVDL